MRGWIGYGASRPNRGCAVVPDPPALISLRVHRNPWPRLGGRARCTDFRRTLADLARLDRQRRVHCRPQRTVRQQHPSRMLRHVRHPCAGGTVHLYGPAWRARSGASTQHGCPMFAGESAFLYVTTTRGRTRKPVRVSCLRPSERAGVVDDTHTVIGHCQRKLAGLPSSRPASSPPTWAGTGN